MPLSIKPFKPLPKIRSGDLKVGSDSSAFCIHGHRRLSTISIYHPGFGYVTLATPEPLVLHDGDEWTESGTITVTGANNSKAKLITIDHLTCTVEVDRDGDGTYEWDSGVLNWEDL